MVQYLFDNNFRCFHSWQRTLFFLSSCVDFNTFSVIMRNFLYLSTTSSSTTVTSLLWRNASAARFSLCFCAFSRFYPGLLLAGVGAVVPKCTIMLIFTTAFYVRERILHLLTVWSINVQSKRLSMPSAPTSLFHPSLVLPMQRCFSPFSVSVLQTQQKVHPTCWISWLVFFSKRSHLFW